MLRGYYNAAQAMINQQRILDAISNNISNIGTSGFKADQVVTNTFQEELILVNGRTQTSNKFLQTYVDQSPTNLEQSNFEYSDNRYDFAIWGNMYFNIKAVSGNVLQTKAGQFELDSEGYLCLGAYGRVQGQNGDIYLGDDDFVVDSYGNIENENGFVDTLSLTYIPPDADVTKIGHSLYSYTGGETLPEGEGYDVVQGAFEKSNVDGNSEMTKAMDIQRLYEANSKILQYIDSINTKAASEIAKL